MPKDIKKKKIEIQLIIKDRNSIVPCITVFCYFDQRTDTNNARGGDIYEVIKHLFTYKLYSLL